MKGYGTVVECDLNTGVLTVAFKDSAMRVKFPQSFSDGTLYFQTAVLEELKQELKKSVATAKTKPSSYYSSKKTSKVHLGATKKDEDFSWADRKVNNRSESSKPKTISSKSKTYENPYDWDEELPRSCDTCILMKREDCAGLKNPKTCKRYSPIPNITRAEKYHWPTQGIASDFRFGKKKR